MPTDRNFEMRSFGKIFLNVFLVLIALQVTLIPGMASTEVSQDGLVGWWSFNEGEGETVVDSSPSQVNGELFGASWGEGIEKGGASFSGSNQWLTVPSGSAFEFEGELTVFFWMKPTGASARAEAQYLVGKNSAWWVRFWSDSRIHFGIVTHTRGYEAYSLAQIPLGEWSCVACIYNGRTLSIYINGELDSEQPTEEEQGLLSTNQQPLVIGACPWDKETLNFEGSIDQVIIYSRALKAEEVKQLYNLTSGGSR